MGTVRDGAGFGVFGFGLGVQGLVPNKRCKGFR